MSTSPYSERRERLLASMGPGVLVVPSAPVAIRNNDVEHDYRQSSDFYYLTGLDEPESVLVLTNQHGQHRCVLFVRPRNPEREVWDGARTGVEGAKMSFGADAAFPIEELTQRLPDYLLDAPRLHCRLGEDPAFDRLMIEALANVRRRARGGVIAPAELVDPSVGLHEMRLRKGIEELALMARAVEVTQEAHAGAMQVARPGRYEYEVEAELLRTFRAHGSERPAYGSIVGSGPNATVLHYRKNNRQMQDGDLLLIDAGAEVGYYASDVTRTFPVNGRFSDAQRRIYEIVLEAEMAAIERVRPNANLQQVHDAAVEVLARGLVALGLIEGPWEKAVGTGAYKAFYMHRTSHWIGMDVHDVGAYYTDKRPRPLEPGFVITVEPGLYIAPDAPVDPKWRGIGVRIEDDIAVTSDGYRNLTAAIPKEVAALEQALAQRG